MTTTKRENATGNLFIKIRPSQKSFIRKAADASFQTQSAFVLAAATRAAKAVLADEPR